MCCNGIVLGVCGLYLEELDKDPTLRDFQIHKSRREQVQEEVRMGKVEPANEVVKWREEFSGSVS